MLVFFIFFLLFSSLWRFTQINNRQDATSAHYVQNPFIVMNIKNGIFEFIPGKNLTPVNFLVAVNDSLALTSSFVTVERTTPLGHLPVNMQDRLFYRL